MPSKSKSVAETEIYNVQTDSTGAFDVPVGTTAQRPSSPTSGNLRFNSTINALENYNGNVWLKVAAAFCQLNTVTGNIYAGVAGSDLTLAGSGFLTSNLVVNFSQSADNIDVDVTVTPSSDSAATVSVPSSVFSNVTAGRVVAIKVTNSDNSTTAPVNKTAVALPSGGTITTSGNFRIHSFTSSGTFTNTIANLSTEILIVAAGGGGGEDNGGGGGGGAVAVSTNPITMASTGSSTITVGAGGAGGAGGNQGGRLGNLSSINGLVPSPGGGYSIPIAYGGGGGMASFGSGTVTSSHGSYNQDQANGGGGAGVSDGASGVGNGRPGLAHTVPTYTTSDGNTGGNGSANQGEPYASGGGAGSGGNGVNFSGSTNPNGTGGNGGVGTASSITGSAVTYAGGGGGGVYGSNTIGTGTNGGGNGAQSGSNGNAGSANTGGGGGGAGRGASNGGNGGSGLVVIRYNTTTI